MFAIRVWHRLERCHGVFQSRHIRSCSSSNGGVSLSYDENNGNPVAVVRLDRPERMNSINNAMGHSLLQLSKNLISETRAVMITGAGEKAFSTGRDLKESKKHSREDARAYMQLCLDSALAVKQLAIPTVAVINGYAFGWGIELALACDLRIAKSDAVMCFPECGLGIFPGAAGTVHLSRLVGPGVAKDLIFTSRRFTGDEALSLGVVNRSIKGTVKETYEAGLEYTKAIAKNGPLGLQGAKIVIDKGLDIPFAEHVELSNKHRFPLNDTEDFQNALIAFENKQTPVFKGV